MFVRSQFDNLDQENCWLGHLEKMEENNWVEKCEFLG